MYLLNEYRKSIIAKQRNLQERWLEAIKQNFYDTNAILLLQDRLLKEEKFYISSTTLQELEHIKVSRNKDEEIKYRARKVLHILDENADKYEVIIVDKYVLDIIENHGLENTPDNQICACATTKDCVFVTNDIACKTIAKWIFGLEVSSVSENGDEIYKG